MKLEELTPVKINEAKCRKTIGLRIMQKRKANGVTQSELAEITGISCKQISNIENGHSFPRMGTFLKLCAYFDVNSDYFISGTIGKEINDKIIELLSTCTIEELKCIWKLMDCYLHRDDNKNV